VSVYLVQRLISEGTLSEPTLLEALVQSEHQGCSVIESLVSSDLRHAYTVARCFVGDGEKADNAWRPDPRLVLDLPPGICERMLAFPFRERAGSVEVATVTPLDKRVQEEFTFHLRRPVALFRANLQALLAAAGAPIDLGVLTHSLSEPPPRPEASPIPLVRKLSRHPEPRPRTRTSPGIGEQESASIVPPPSLPREHMRSLQILDDAQDIKELCHALSALLSAPYLILEIGDGDLTPRVASSKGSLFEQPVARWEECALNVAADEGKFMGSWESHPVHERFSHLFQEGDFVVAERIGSLDHGLVVVQKVRFDGYDDGEFMDRARIAWESIRGAG
jgi:hypothetical protein